MSFHSWLRRHSDLLAAYSSLFAIVSLPLLLAGGIWSLLQIQEYVSRPDAHLVFDSGPRFWVANGSDKVMDEAKYGLVIFDLDREGKNEPAMNLRIPFERLNAIRPESALGPWSILEVATQADQVQDGDRLFGYGRVSCPECVTVRRYWLYALAGGPGWYSEVPPENPPPTFQKVREVLHAGQRDAKIEALVPSDRRISFR